MMTEGQFPFFALFVQQIPVFYLKKSWQIWILLEENLSSLVTFYPVLVRYDKKNWLLKQLALT